MSPSPRIAKATTPAPVTLVLDNSFAARLGAVAVKGKPAAKSVTFGNIFMAALDLPSVKAAIIPDYVYTKELKNTLPAHTKRGTTFYEKVHEPVDRTIKARLEASADLIYRNGHQTRNEQQLQVLLDSPNQMPSKLLLSHSPRLLDFATNTRRNLDYEKKADDPNAFPIEHHEALKKHDYFRNGLGEQTIAELIEQTRFGGPVMVLSDDANAFVVKKSPQWVGALKSADADVGGANAHIAVCNTYGFFDALSKSPEALDYISKRLRAQKSLPDTFEITPRDLMWEVSHLVNGSRAGTPWEAGDVHYGQWPARSPIAHQLNPATWLTDGAKQLEGLPLSETMPKPVHSRSAPARHDFGNSVG